MPMIFLMIIIIKNFGNRSKNHKMTEKNLCVYILTYIILDEST